MVSQKDTLNSLFAIFCTHNVNRPYVHALRYAIAIANFVDDKEKIKKLEYIRDNTDEEVKIPYANLEFWYLRDYSRSASKTFFYDDEEFSLATVIEYLNKAYIEITRIVSEIAKKQNMVIPFNMEMYG